MQIAMMGLKIKTGLLFDYSDTYDIVKQVETIWHFLENDLEIDELQKKHAQFENSPE